MRALALPPDNISYMHKCPKNNALLGQEGWLGHELSPIDGFCSDQQNVGVVYDSNTDSKIFLINTWVGQLPGLFKGCNFATNYLIFEKIFNSFGLRMPAVENLLIDCIEATASITTEGKQKTVLLCNGPVHSGQAPNIDLNFLIPLLRSKGYFVYTTAPAVISSDITNICSLEHMKLPEIGRIAAYEANVIIGRASGPYAFAQTRQSLMDASHTFISFTHERNDSIWYEFAKAKQVWSNKFDRESMMQTVLENI